MLTTPFDASGNPPRLFAPPCTKLLSPGILLIDSRILMRILGRGSYIYITCNGRYLLGMIDQRRNLNLLLENCIDRNSISLDRRENLI